MKLISLIVGVLGLALTGASAMALAVAPQTTETVDINANVPTDSEGEPKLSVDQRDQALRLLRTDETATKFLGDRNYIVRNIGPWIERDELARARSVGATVIVALEKPVTYEMQDWPVISYEGDPSADSPEEAASRSFGDRYVEETARFGASGVRALLIDIDLNQQKVVSIQPDSGGVEYELSPQLEQQAEEAKQEAIQLSEEYSTNER